MAPAPLLGMNPMMAIKTVRTARTSRVRCRLYFVQQGYHTAINRSWWREYYMTMCRSQATNSEEEIFSYSLLQDGCQVSGWWADMLKQIFFAVSNLPFGCQIRWHVQGDNMDKKIICNITFAQLIQDTQLSCFEDLFFGKGHCVLSEFIVIVIIHQSRPLSCQLTWQCYKAGLTVSIMMLGGFMGYCGGNVIRPWYLPPAKSLSGGPRTQKCHSKRLSCNKNTDTVAKLVSIYSTLHLYHVSDNRTTMLNVCF